MLRDVKSHCLAHPVFGFTGFCWFFGFEDILNYLGGLLCLHRAIFIVAIFVVRFALSVSFLNYIVMLL